MITARELYKVYRIGRPAGGSGYWQRLVNAPARNWRRLTSRSRMTLDADEAGSHFALRDVSFSAARGEVLGIIGHNGAGKSTLLKVLSRITDPTSGRVDINGRVSSLLEVGTGFHGELSGRDNVYLNGTILGMRRAEVAAKFDEIVAFSGVEAHIDTPVKFYSSGMQVRLAFAVAAHLEPEVLLIDEVLAVGDLAFQEKCLGKMDRVSRSGRTVLFVSHQLGAVEGLCKRCLLLEGGRKVYDGSVAGAITRYRNAASQHADSGALHLREDRAGAADFRFERLRINDGQPALVGAPVSLALDYRARHPVRDLRVLVRCCLNFRECIMTLDSHAEHGPLRIEPGTGTLHIALPRLDLLPGRYFIDLTASAGGRLEDQVFRAGVLTVADRDLYGSGNTPNARDHGLIASPVCTWRHALAD